MFKAFLGHRSLFENSGLGVCYSGLGVCHSVIAIRVNQFQPSGWQLISVHKITHLTSKAYPTVMCHGFLNKTHV